MDCRACVDTFLAAPYDEAGITTHRDAVLWLWRTHNYVSGVAIQQPSKEKAFAEDPAFPPSHFWPPRHICHECWKMEKTLEEQAVHEAAMHLMESHSPRIWVPSFDESSCNDAPSLCPGKAGDWDFDSVFKFLCKFYGTGQTLEGHTFPDMTSGDEVQEVEMLGVKVGGNHASSVPTLVWGLSPWAGAICAVCLLVASIVVRQGWHQHNGQSASMVASMSWSLRHSTRRQVVHTDTTDVDGDERILLMSGDPTCVDE